MRRRYVVISASVASLLLLSLSPVAIAQKTLTNKKASSGEFVGGLGLGQCLEASFFGILSVFGGKTFERRIFRGSK